MGVAVLSNVYGLCFVYFLLAIASGMNMAEAGRLFAMLGARSSYRSHPPEHITLILSQYAQLAKCSSIMAGAGGFEPPNTGIKSPGLAAWRRPNKMVTNTLSNFVSFLLCLFCYS